jgi:hypothetical protein
MAQTALNETARDPARKDNGSARVTSEEARHFPTRADGNVFHPMLSWHHWLQQSAACNAAMYHDWWTFIDKRLKEDAALSTTLAESKSIDMAVSAYTAFMHTAVDDYHRALASMTRYGTQSLVETQLPRADAPPAVSNKS